MAIATGPKITAEEFLRMDLGEGLHELVRGEIVSMPPPEYAHGYVCANVATELNVYGRRTRHGHAATNDSRVGISDDTVRGADVAYYREDRWPRARVGQGPPPGLPDLVVEVLSPSDRPRDVIEKVGDDLQAGIAMVWVADPGKRRLTIYRQDDPTPTVLAESDTLENLPELPGFRCPVIDIFT